MNTRVISLFLAVVMLVAMAAGCAPAVAPEAPSGEAAAETVTLEFTQWWEPELPEGEFRALMDEFEAQNPGRQG